MKKLFLSIVLLFSATLMFAQTPNAFNYQAVARNNSGAVLQSTAIAVLFTIHDVTAGGTSLYSERQTVTTNAFGLFAVQIGTGTVESGTFASINWGSANKYLQVEFDPAGGTSYINMGTTQLISVPYAKVADVALNSPWAINGNNINNTNSGYVGIGTASPATPLNVVSATESDIATFDGDNGMFITLSELGTPKGYIGSYSGAADDVDFGTYGSNSDGGVNFVIQDAIKMSIAHSGNVGIGTTAPSYPLHIVSSVNSGIWLDGTDSTYAGFFANAEVSTAKPFYGYAVGGAQEAYTEADNAGDWFLINNGYNNSLAIAAMASGKVGIGTSSPSGQLTVINDGSGLGYPTISATNTDGTGIGIAIGTNSSDATAVFTNAAGSTNASAIMAKFFDGGSSDLVRIDNGGTGYHIGRISIFGDNTSSGDGGVLYATTNYGMDLGDIVGNTYTTMFEAYHPTPTTTAVSPWENDITSSGDATYHWSAVYATNGTIQTSDERLKENVQPLSYGLNELMSLNPVSFQWKNQQARLGTGSNLGFLAQDLEKVLPDVVVHTQITQEQIDNAKKYKGVDIANTDTYGVKYSEIIPVLVKAIQEQQAEIEALKLQVSNQQK